MANPFFSKFPSLQYDISGEGNYVTLTDISRTVDISNINEDSVSYYTFYDIQDGDRPDIISQKLYGTPNYYWTFFIVNDQLKTGINNSWPSSAANFEKMIINEYDDYSAIIFKPELAYAGSLIQGHGDFSVIPLDSKYAPSIKITDISNTYTASILKYDYAMMQLVVYNIVEISTGKTSSAIKNAFLDCEQFKLNWVNQAAVTPVAATLTTGDAVTNNQILYTALEAGSNGNNISITYDSTSASQITHADSDGLRSIVINPERYESVVFSFADKLIFLVKVIGENGNPELNNGQPIFTTTGSLTNAGNTWILQAVGTQMYYSWNLSGSDAGIAYTRAAYFVPPSTYSGDTPYVRIYPLDYNNVAIVAAINSHPVISSYLKAETILPLFPTGSGIFDMTDRAVVDMRKTALSGGLGAVPTDPTQLALYAQAAAAEIEWVNRIIAQYDKIDGFKNGIAGGAYDQVLNGTLSKDDYVSNKTYHKASHLEFCSWEYYKYAPYQYFKRDELDSAVTRPDSAFGIITANTSDIVYISGFTTPGVSNTLTRVTTSDGLNSLFTNADVNWVDAAFYGVVEGDLAEYPAVTYLYYNGSNWDLVTFPAGSSFNEIIFSAISDVTSNSIWPSGLTYTTYLGTGTPVVARQYIPNISYYEKEQLDNDAKRKIKVVRPDLIRNFEKTYFAVLAS